MYKFHLFIATCGCLSVSISYGHVETLDDGDAIKTHKEKFLGVERQALMQVNQLYFAFGCHVIGQGEVTILNKEYLMNVTNESRWGGYWDRRLSDKDRREAQLGFERSQSEGCDYWKSHIAEAESLRGDALAAAGLVAP